MPHFSSRATECRICGSKDLVSYSHRGGRATRPYCREHWRQIKRDYKREKELDARRREGIPEGWRRNGFANRKPTQGHDRIVINREDRLVTFYSMGFYKGFRYDQLKRLNTPTVIREFYTAIGYQIISHDSRYTILERPYEMRIRRRLMNWRYHGSPTKNSV